MSSALNTTFETLAASRNDAANPLLMAALNSSDEAVSEGAMKAVISRRNKAGHLAILERWHTLSPHQREFLQEGRGRMSSALRDAVLSGDAQLFANACELVEHFQEFDLVSTLVTLAENQKSPHAEAATRLVWRLVQQLSELIHQPNDDRKRRNPNAIRLNVLESLERSVERYRTHQRTELIEAYVVLCGAESTVLRKILDDPHHPCYLTVINTLTQSQSVGVIQMLLRSLQNEHCSPNLRNVISKRDDPEFVSQLLEFADQGFSAKTVKNLARIRSFAWLQHGERGFDNFEEQDQARCVKLIASSGVKSDEFLDLLESVLKNGGPNARLTACEALASISGDRGNHLVLDAIADGDPQVQASATRQLRDRHVPGAMVILMKQIDSPHDEVRKATCEALAEFSFSNFLVGYEGLNDEARSSTALLVKKVDSACAEGILKEMESGSRKRRLRAIEIAELMDVIPQVSDGLLQLLEDEDHLVRAAAAEACRSAARRL